MPEIMIPEPGRANSAGALDGMTILRFTHATEAAGGVEQYLNDLNQVLLQRNAMTIIQLCLPLAANLPPVPRAASPNPSLIHIPMVAERSAAHQRRGLIASLVTSCRLKNLLRDAVLSHPVLYAFVGRQLAKRPYSRYDREPRNICEILDHLFGHHAIDLIVIHLAGGWGSAQVIREAARRHIPYVIMNHFSNERFNTIGFREQVKTAAGIGGVSGNHVPQYLSGCYQNLSDGIDTDFFSIQPSAEPPEAGAIPLILVPARVVPAKGQRDMIGIARRLKRSGFVFKIAFAGETRDHPFLFKLTRLIRKLDLSDAISFLGPLNREELRRAYASARVVVLPSHNEGLGRALLEAQSMEVPVIAYNVGGISESLVDGISGYLVAKGNLRALASKITELLTDDQKRIAMGKAGRQFVTSKFSLPAFAQRHENWYRRALQAKSADHRAA